jgi:DNA-binding NarL/FixJ family response regulator
MLFDGFLVEAPMGTFRILLADDHPVFRLGLCSLLGSHESWEICGQASDGREAVNKCKQLKPDLLILDIGMPELNGVDAARRILKDNPRQRILVLTDLRSEQTIRDCLEAGVRGWVYKSDDPAELITAVEALQQYRSMFSSRVCDLILDGYLLRRPSGPVALMPPRLSFREREVVQLVGEGRTSKEVAARLGISLKTAETHRSNILIKLNLHSTVELVLYAVQNNIVDVVHFPLVVRRAPHNGNGHAQIAV